jgi:hypothetical protein
LPVVPPRWILEPTDKAFAQGSDAKVECKADGFPRPQVTWKRAAGKKYTVVDISSNCRRNHGTASLSSSSQIIYGFPLFSLHSCLCVCMNVTEWVYTHAHACAREREREHASSF